ncbi:MAG: helix-turn-helix transcriptional regulator, partial [Kibdelosporangium sp.]
MTEPNRSTFLRRKLGAKLRRMREEAGLTLDTAAPKLDRTRSALHRVETGETKADVHLVKSMMDLYDSYDPDLLDEARAAAKPPWYRAYGLKVQGYVDVETEAARVIQFVSIDIPGLLQTEGYMRALFRTGYGRSEQQMDNDVAVRLIRQRRLTDEDRPLDLIALLHEAALRRMVGGPVVMREQLRHLAELSELPTVAIRVVPLGVRDHYVPNGTFNVLSFPEPADPDLLYVEYPTGSLHIEAAAEVKQAKLILET